MIVLLEYPSPKGGLMASVNAEVRLTPKRIFVEKRIGPIHYLRRVGTKKALDFRTPKVFDRATGQPIGPKNGFRTWVLGKGEILRLTRADGPCPVLSNSQGDDQ